MRLRSYLFIFFAIVLVACGRSEPDELRLATTTSTYDSGLLDAILPDFEASHNAIVDVVAVGTGQAIALGEAGDVDVILVHARSREDAFISEGHGTQRTDVMYNDFVLVGPAFDPAGIRDMALAKDALTTIATQQAAFASRGDDSGTHTKEKKLWEQAGMSPSADDEWYNSLGQGMGNTLIFANEQLANTLTDRGTFLSIRDNIPELEILVGGGSIAENHDSSLLNPYGVIPVNPDKGGINNKLAIEFVEWLVSLETQGKIAEYGIEIHYQPLFYPNSESWHNR